SVFYFQYKFSRHYSSLESTAPDRRFSYPSRTLLWPALGDSCAPRSQKRASRICFPHSSGLSNPVLSEATRPELSDGGTAQILPWSWPADRSARAPRRCARLRHSWPQQERQRPWIPTKRGSKSL